MYVYPSLKSNNATLKKEPYGNGYTLIIGSNVDNNISNIDAHDKKSDEKSSLKQGSDSDLSSEELIEQGAECLQKKDQISFDSNFDGIF